MGTGLSDCRVHRGDRRTELHLISIGCNNGVSVSAGTFHFSLATPFPNGIATRPVRRLPRVQRWEPGRGHHNQLNHRLHHLRVGVPVGDGYTGSLNLLYMAIGW